MSYNQLSSVEAGEGGGAGRQEHPAPFTDDPRFSRLAQDLENRLFSLTSNMADLRAELARRDTPRTRERIHNLLEQTKTKFQEAGEALKNIQTWEDVTPTQKYKQQKLSRQLKDGISDFRILQNKALEKEKWQVADAKAHQDQHGAHSSSVGSGGGEQMQLHLQEQELSHLAAQDDVDLQDALIREREQEIVAIEQGVGDLNVLFTQVAQIVNEQGEMINTITDNIEDVHDATQGADAELRQAARYQRNARSKMCCLLIILAVILTVIILAVVLS